MRIVIIIPVNYNDPHGTEPVSISIVCGIVVAGVAMATAVYAGAKLLEAITPAINQSVAEVAARISKNADEQSIEDGLTSIASSYDNFECDIAAKNMQDFMSQNGKHGEIITISYTGGRGYVWSDIRQKTVNETGLHVGVSFNGIVYCNVHPLGLPESVWIDDFVGTGVKTVSRLPF